MKISRTYLLWTLGLLTAFGPYITDLYLSSLPEQVEYFGTTPALVQLGLTTSMAGLAVGQLVIGPLSDHLGRKKPLLVCLVLFIAITVISILSPNILTFITLRFFQGFAGASGIVLSRSIATDLFEGRELMKAMGTMGSVNGIAPVTAPPTIQQGRTRIGALLITVTDWRGIFVFLTLIGVALLALAAKLPETLDETRRNPRNPITVFLSLGSVFKDRCFRLTVLQQCFAFSVLFGYIASSPFIYQKIYGLSSIGYSVMFGINACGIGLGAVVSSKMMNPERVLVFGSAGLVLFSLLVGGSLLTGASLWLLEPCFFLLLVSLGTTFPTASSIAMSRQRKMAGAASAVLGASGFVAGGIVSPLVGLYSVTVSTSIVLIAAALGALGLSLIVRTAVQQATDSPQGVPLDI